MRKRIFLAGLAMTALIAVAILLLASVQRPAITKANCDRIQVGMQKVEVEAILGGSAQRAIEFGDERFCLTWKSYECVIYVCFVDGCVAARDCVYMHPDERTAWEKLLAMVWRRDPSPDPAESRPRSRFPKELDSLEEADRVDQNLTP